MKHKKKYAFGGITDPVGGYLNIQRQRASSIPTQIENPGQTIAENNLRLNRAEQKAISNPYTQGLDIFGNVAMQVGSSMMNKGIADGQGEDGKGLAGFLNKNQDFINSILMGSQVGAMYASGGVAGNRRINVEGGEVVETPDGVPQELLGPSHAEGGIDMDVPDGTEIYSDRLRGSDGKTMAERKITREKQLAKVEKLLKKNPNDEALKRTLEKTKQNNDLLDNQDLSQMQFVKDLVDQTNKFGEGGYAGGKPVPTYIDRYRDISGIFNKDKNLLTDVGTSYTVDPIVENLLKKQNAQDIQGIQYGVSAPASTESEGKYGNPVTTKKENVSPYNFLGDMTMGDIIGMGSNLFGAKAQMDNTLANRSATPVEQNWFKDYGKESLSKIQDQYGLLDNIRDTALQTLDRDRSAAISRNNSSARSINTQRALNLATDATVNNSKSALYSKFAEAMMGIKGQEAAQMAKNDEARMGGEDKRAERELQNTDNFYASRGQALNDLYEGFGKTGRDLNKFKERGVINDILKGTNPNFEYDPFTKKWTYKKDKGVEVGKVETNLRTVGSKQAPEVVSRTTGPAIGTISAEGTSTLKGKHLTVKNVTQEDVTNVQNALKKLNMSTLDLNDPKAIQQFQKAIGMSAKDISAGKFGPKTLKAIQNYLNKK